MQTGCAYYPEHWSEDRWAQDAQTMREAGLSVVRLAEFAWDKLEPSPGVYDFDWLDRAIDTLAAEGLKIVLCTPTPTPPPWLTHLHPEICRVREDGVRISPGGRRHACANVPAYLRYCERIVQAVAEHFGDHPHVVGWQVDNEFGCGETTRCYCDHCRSRFHEWLRERYGNLEALNEAWGTQFWGMTYHEWDHIPIPGITTEPQSPSMRLDYRRFSSDSWVRFQRMQIELLRHFSPERWITHNFMIRHWSLDYWKLAEDLDFVSYDNYPHGLRNPAETALNLDLMWSLKRQLFWVMEQQPGPVNWHPYNPPVPKGQVRLWSHQAIAHGAETVVYFRYRAAPFGQEQFHHGLLKWDGSKDQAFFEAQQVSAEFTKVPALQRPRATVGIVFDYESLWSTELEPYHRDFSYWNLLYDIYETFWKNSIAVDFLPRNADLSGYETVIVPAAVIVHEEEVEKWRAWVESGGRLVLTFRSFTRTLSNRSVMEDLPAAVQDLIGGRVATYDSVPPASYADWYNHRVGHSIRPVDAAYVAFDYKIWAESLIPTTAQARYKYTDGLYTDQIAMTVNKIGAGDVYYLGCWPVRFSDLARAEGWIPPVRRSVRQAELQAADGAYWQIIMNHREYPVDDLDAFDVQYVKLADDEQ